MPEDGRPVEYFDSIQAIVNVKPRRFLVRTSIVGYQLSVEGGASSWVPLEIPPGQVLTTGIVYMDQKKSKSNVKNFFKKILKPVKHSQKDQELKYLQCFDTSAREVMIPLIMTGVFSPVGDLTNNDFDSVYELQDLVASFSLPVRAQLIHADPDAGALPSGLLMIEGVKEELTIVVGIYPVNEYSELFEIPTTAKIHFRKDVSQGHASKRKKEPVIMDTEERIYENSAPSELEVELPVRIKTSKKSKGPGIFDKLSLRSKGKKERATLKQLQEEGVFSSRLTKSDFNLEAYADDDGDVDGSKTSQGDKVESQRLDYTDDNDPVYRPTQYSQEETVYQGRNLPPIPKSPEEREPLYEELPVAPSPPSEEVVPCYKPHAQDDDYMSPAQVRREKERSGVYNKPPIAPRNSTKTKDSVYKSHREDPLDFDKLFPFTEDGIVREINKPETEFGDSQMSVQDFEIPQYSSAINTQTADCTPYHGVRMRAYEHRMDSDPFNSLTRMRSRSHKNLVLDPNATLRSHNIRHVNNVMNVFDDINSPVQHPDSALSQESVPVREFSHRLSLFEPAQFDRRSLYATSEPGSKRYQRSMSSIGINEMSFSRQEDSVLSGDYGYHGGSEYSYAEYGEEHNDGWRPPIDLSNLSVQEVSRSLRYIGMKDRVVKRLANEQIDGQLLCSLDKNLLREGFPELNALDVKKIVDFIKGWRPKK